MDMVVNRVMEMTTLPLDELIILQGDLKALSKDAYHKFRKQLLENGFTSPFHIWRDPKTKKPSLLDGTQRLKVLKMMRDDGVQLPATLPAVVIEAQDKPHALRILLALATQYGKMTDESLSEFAIDSGISLEWIENHIELPDNLMVHIEPDMESKDGLIDDDEVPEVAESFVKLGDLYQLGNHRLMCGDSTSIDAVQKLMDGEKADMVFTDPPYGISYKNSDFRGNLKGTSNKMDMIANDNVILDFGSLFLFDCVKYVWGANNFTHVLPKKGIWHCWDKRSDSVDDTKTMDCCIGSQFELVWVDKDSGYQRLFRVQHAGFKNADGGKRVHPTQKPTQLAEMCFEHEKIKPEARVIDLFGGSGSTLIACEKTNRKCFMMELDPHYCAVIIERWEKFTGLQVEKIN